MADLTIDLATQARPGETFALEKVAGGTGRADGHSLGWGRDVTNRTDGSTILWGMIVERASSTNLGPGITVQATNAATDKPLGVAAQDIVAGEHGFIVQASGAAQVLTTGTIAVGDTLYTSGTSGRATATFTAGSYAIGISLSDASGTSSVWAIVTILPAVTQITAHSSLSGLTSGDDHTQYLRDDLADAKGDIIAATAADTWARVPVGTNDQVLVADSAQASGVRWGTSASAVLTTEEDDAPAIIADTLVFADGAVSDLGGNDAYISEAPVHIVSEQGVNGNGTQTVWYLENIPEADTLAIYNAGTRVWNWTLATDAVTFTSAPSNGNTIYFDYLAEAAA